MIKACIKKLICVPFFAFWKIDISQIILLCKFYDVVDYRMVIV